MTASYDYRLVAVSIALSGLASLVALDVAGRIAAARDGARLLWLACGASAMGVGIWSMHYLGMLAYQLTIPVEYDWPTVAASLIAAVLASAVALYVIGSASFGGIKLALGGTIMGLGIAAMHYIGMAALRLQARPIYNPWLVMLSIAVSIVVSIIAVELAFRLRGEVLSFSRKKLLAAAVMGSAIPLLHYIGMAAVVFVPIAVVLDLSRSLTISTLVMANIVCVVVIVLCVAIATSFVDRRFALHFAELKAEQRSLAESEGRSSKRALRIEAISRVARETEQLSYEDRARAILQIATDTMRPGCPTVGSLTHFDRGAVVIDEVTTMYGAESDTFDRVLTLVYPGNSFPIENSMHEDLYRAGKTLAWETIAVATFGERASICEDFGIRSLIGTPVIVGAKTRFVMFEFLESNADDPFGEDDIAFVDVVGAFLTNGFQRQSQAERLKFQMEHDALTGLGNRIQLRAATQACVRAGEPFAIAVLNLDRFREINVVHGNLVADELLVEVATSLAAVDARDLVVRRNGDEFTILLHGAGAADASERVGRYLARFAAPFGTSDRGRTRFLTLGCSIGTALFPRDGDTGFIVASRAQLALEFARQRLGSVALPYDAEMDAAITERWLDNAEVERAIAQNEFLLLYQPTFDLITRDISGAEALIRWDHPTRGRVMPAEFIAFVEQRGLLGALSRWVFERLARDLESASDLPRDMRCYMNVAAQLLDDSDFASFVHQRLRAAPALVLHLGFEITESGAMLNIERSIFALESFRRDGIKIAIDDFGTGFSSLSYLKRLPADLIKIDKSFVDGIPHDYKDTTLADTFIWLGNAFGFQTLAEGIEREEQATWLKAHGCRFGQGHLVSEAIPFADFRALVGPRAAASLAVPPRAARHFA